MNLVFSASRLTIPLDTWVNLMDEPFTIYYNGKLNEFSSIADDRQRLPGFKKVSANQIVDICSHFRPSLTEKQEKKIGIDLSFLGFVQQANYEGIFGKVWAIFAKIFNWIVRGEFATSADRCKDLAQDLLGIKPILTNKEYKKEFIEALKAYKKIYEVKADSKVCLLNECLGRWLVSKQSLNHIIKKVYEEEQLAV